MSDPEISLLHIGDLGSGGARGAYSLHRGLLENGIYSLVLLDSNSNLSDITVFSMVKDNRGKLALALR